MGVIAGGAVAGAVLGGIFFAVKLFSRGDHKWLILFKILINIFARILSNGEKALKGDESVKITMKNLSILATPLLLGVALSMIQTPKPLF